MIGLPVLRRVCGFSLHILSIFLALILTAFCFLVYGIDGTRIVYVSDWSGVGPVKQWAETGEAYGHPIAPFESNTPLSEADVAFISCNPVDFVQPFALALAQKPAGIVLFSLFRDDFCDVPISNPGNSIAMASPGVTRARLIKRNASPEKIATRIFARQTSDFTPDKAQQSVVMGAPPNTSVALIILYSITGVVTGLFLLVIVTGAIRAHRHPERYGPRTVPVQGRPRQSRAKGIARAVLDTIPIVRFGAPRDGEVEPTKETRDLEMQSGTDLILQENIIPTVEVTEPPPAHNPSAVEINRNEEGGLRSSSETVPISYPADLSQDQCPVCLDDFEQGQPVRVLPCHHNFHPTCIDPWLLNVSGSCPLCRIDLHPPRNPENGEEDSDDNDGLGTPNSSLSTPDPPHQTHLRRNHRRHSQSRLSRYLDIARGTSGAERMAALRRHREENQSPPDNPQSIRRNRMSEISISTLRRVLGSPSTPPPPPPPTTTPTSITANMTASNEHHA